MVPLFRLSHYQPKFSGLVLTHIFSLPTLNQSRRETFFPFSDHILFLSANASFFLLFYTRYHNVLLATIFPVCYKSRLLLSCPPRASSRSQKHHLFSLTFQSQALAPPSPYRVPLLLALFVPSHTSPSPFVVCLSVIMGGKAFANHNPPLQTPRMPGSVYHEVKRRVEHRLSKAFSVVRFPIEGPAKQDFGDVDVFVTGPRFQSQGDEYTRREYLDHISAVLGATAVIEDAGVQEPSGHFAIPWPRDLEHLSDSPNPQEPTYAVAGPSTSPSTSAQIDSPTPRSFSAQIGNSPYPSFPAQVGTSTHPGASAPAVRSPYGSVSTPSNASPSTPVTATTPTLPSFPAVPSAHSNAVTPTEFPLPRSRFDGTHAKPNQRPDVRPHASQT